MSEPSASEVSDALHRGHVLTITTWAGCGAPVGSVMDLGLNGLPSVPVRVLTCDLIWDGKDVRERLTIELADHPRYTPSQKPDEGH